MTSQNLFPGLRSLGVAAIMAMVAITSFAAENYQAGIPSSGGGGGRSAAGAYVNYSAVGQVSSAPTESAHYNGSGGMLTQFLAGEDELTCQPPGLNIRMLTKTEAQLTWQSCAGRMYRVEWTEDFRTWQSTAVAMAAPTDGGPMSANLTVSRRTQFFRVKVE
jgi:hypothetical protein